MKRSLINLTWLNDKNMEKNNYKLVDPYLVGFHPDLLAENWVKRSDTIRLFDYFDLSTIYFPKGAVFLVYATFDHGLLETPYLEVIGPNGEKHSYTVRYNNETDKEKFIFIPINVSVDSEP